MKDFDIVKNFSLLLLYLTSWKENPGESYEAIRSWRSYDWDALDALEESGFIVYNRRAKSAYLTDEGIVAAQKLHEVISNIEDIEL